MSASIAVIKVTNMNQQLPQYDAPAFDPYAETYPLPFFEPMIRTILAKPENTTYSALMDELQ